MAALVNTTPILVLFKPLVCMTVKVVPKLVEHNAAPAAKACSGEAFTSTIKTKENAIGNTIPVSATRDERKKLALRLRKDVVKPPGWVLATYHAPEKRRLCPRRPVTTSQDILC